MVNKGLCVGITSVLVLAGIGTALYFLLKSSSNSSSVNRGLILVDVQNDFILPDGSLSAFNDKIPEVDSAHPRGTVNYKSFRHKISLYLNESIDLNYYNFIIYSIDYHPENHCSFDEEKFKKGEFTDKCEVNETKHGKQNAWPKHCVQGSQGSKIVEGIPNIKGKKEHILVTNKDTKKKPIIKEIFSKYQEVKSTISDVFYIFKGMNEKIDSYSPFKENNDKLTGLNQALIKSGYKNSELDVLGIAYDFCVKFAALDAKKLGYKVNFIKDLTQPIADVQKTDEELKKNGIQIVNSKELLAKKQNNDKKKDDKKADDKKADDKKTDDKKTDDKKTDDKKADDKKKDDKKTDDKKADDKKTDDKKKDDKKTDES